MEKGDIEKPPITKVNKPKQPVLGRLGLLRDRLIYRDALPLSWEEWKQMIIDNRQNGIPEELVPKRFRASKSILDTFQEMLPIVYPGRIANAKSSEAADKARKGLEVTRSFVVDKTGKRLLIHAVNGGIPQIKEEESVVTHKPAEREIGTLHTHPNYDNLPSSGDIFNFLYHKREIGFIVTQLRVIACFRTSNTPTFTNPIIAKGYLEGMGKAKRRELSKSGIWTLNYSDLNELHLATYEAERGSNVFSRKDNIK